MTEKELRERLKQLLREGKKKHVKIGEYDLATPENVHFLKELKSILEQEGAKANDVINEEGYTAGEFYKDLLAGIQKAENMKSGTRPNEEFGGPTETRT